MDRRRHRAAESGFTLIEMIVVILLVGILAVLGGEMIAGPVSGYVDLSRRARLVDQAEMALRRMQRDVRQALPNSLRITAGGRTLELLHTTDGGRYRRYQDPGPGGDDILDFSLADDGFDVLGNLRAAPVAGQNLVVYNITSNGPAGNAYSGLDNRATIAAGSTLSHIRLAPSFQFGHQSPYKRFFILDESITYACEGGDLNRYAGYPIATAPPVGSAALVTRAISDCSFSYDPGASQRAGLVTLRLTLTESGETITLLHQLHVVNAP